MSHKAIAIANNHFEKKIAKTLIWAIGLCALAYALLVSMATFSVVRRISLETKTKYMVSEINSLELSYLDQSESLDMMYAATLGFRDVDKASFATAPNVAYNAR